MSDEERVVVVQALDARAVALADHAHVWAPDERALYEGAIRAAERPGGGRE